MLNLHINEFLVRKGYKSGRWALRKIGMPTSAVYALTRPNVRTIKLEHLEYICGVFDCTPNDLLDYQPEHEDLLEPGHSLLKLRKDHGKQTPMELLKQLKPEEIDQASEMLEGLIRKRGIDGASKR